ncbi:MAG: GxxExxY protein [Gemmatimonadaceae bacterium]
MELDDITGAVVVESIRIHRALGPGLLESVYEAILARSLERLGLRVDRQRAVSFSYDGMNFDDGFRADLLVQSLVLVEVKSVDRFAAVHMKQVLTYLRLMNLRVGLLLNFGAETMKEGIKRIVNDLPPAASSRLRVNQPLDGTLNESR